MENPSTRGPIENALKRYALVEVRGSNEAPASRSRFMNGARSFGSQVRYYGPSNVESPMRSRPPFIVSSGDLPERAHVYPQSEERMGPARGLGTAAGLVRIGINVQRLPPGTRSSWPHAEEHEEEFVYVIEGEVDAWIDGDLHRMVAGDLAAFPAGTGICHCFINNTGREVLLLVGGEAAKPDNRIFYPLNPSRRADLQASQWWDHPSPRRLGPHDGLPDALRI